MTKPLTAARSIAEPCGVLLIALTLRMFRLGQPSLWNDELYSRFYYDLFGPSFLLGPGLAMEPTPPTYYFLLEGWMHLFGTSEAAIRSLSVAASLIVVGLVYFLARNLLPARPAMVAAWLAALCPLDVFFAQEARVYALLMIPFTAALIGFTRFLITPASKVALLTYVCGAVIAIYCHITMVFLVAALGLAGMGHLLAGRERTVGRVGRWVIANALVVALVAPELWIMQVGRIRPDLTWMPPLSLRDLAVVLSSVSTNAMVPMRFPGAELGLLMVVAVGASIRARPLSPVGRTVLLLAPALGLVLMVAASLKQPVLLPRTALWLTIPFCVLLAHGLAGRSAERGLLLAATFVCFGSGLLWQFTLTDEVNKTPWRRIFEHYGDDMRQASLVVLGLKATPLVTAYYLPGATNIKQWRGEGGSSLEGTLIPEKLGVMSITEVGIIQAIGENRHVWLLAQWDDVQRLPMLLSRVKLPSYRQDYFCGGREPCVSAVEWR